ncbi:uncharacterized protein N7482_001930 [Penicillium canariense]|uniref:Uncharacterized protein n=1 Tax=Penicillium canariense TaxID=189055 RepID=A0A9W9IG30_9EURO|nr:uncharacterized protein N7482_001930 [Penicillium canariense]KAJ5176053.1 hypothetical protein N7482_001930 [Penicillium canariense]
MVLPTLTQMEDVLLRPPVPVTHAEVAAVVRGGPLLQIYLQRYRNQVNVTFARGEDAAAFLAYAQATPFYVAGRLTTVEWALRAYVAPHYVYLQVDAGDVSRNIIIENVDSKVTEAVIRRDLHHIHNLAVISVVFQNNNAYVSTSSVGGALYARTCMKSRAFYKDMRISFYEDECAQPLPRVLPTAAASIPWQDRGLFYNPFELLSPDDFQLGENAEEEDEDKDEE